MSQKQQVTYLPDIRSLTVAGALQFGFPEYYEEKSLQDTKPVMHRIGDPTSYKVGVRNLMCFMEECDPKDPLQMLLEKENHNGNGNGLPEKYSVVIHRMYATVTPFLVDEKEVARMRRENERKIYNEQHSRLVANGHDPMELFDEDGNKVGRNPLAMVSSKRTQLQEKIMQLRKNGMLSKEKERMLKDSFDRFLSKTVYPYVRKRYKSFAKVSSKRVKGVAVYTAVPV